METWIPLRTLRVEEDLKEPSLCVSILILSLTGPVTLDKSFNFSASFSLFK